MTAADVAETSAARQAQVRWALLFGNFVTGWGIMVDGYAALSWVGLAWLIACIGVSVWATRAAGRVAA